MHPARAKAFLILFFTRVRYRLAVRGALSHVNLNNANYFSIFFQKYEDGEEVVLWMNTVGPYHNRQETYTYFSLPFCKGAKKSISHYHETLGEAIQGVELDFSGIDLAFKGVYFFIPG